MSLPIRSSSRSSNLTTSSVFSQPSASSAHSSPDVLHNKPPGHSSNHARFSTGNRNSGSGSSTSYFSRPTSASASSRSMVTAKINLDNESTAVILENVDNRTGKAGLRKCLVDSMHLGGDFEVVQARPSKGRTQFVLRFDNAFLARQAIEKLICITLQGSAVRVVEDCIHLRTAGSELSKQWKGTRRGPVICDGSVMD